MNYSKYIKIFSGPVLAILIYLCFDLLPGQPVVTKMAAIAVWMAVWWLSEAVHLAVTALLPMILFPLMGILDSKTSAIQYMDPIIFLFIGGFIIAFAIEHWNLHKRIALKILIVVGSSPSKILFGVMITSFILSMWISNTATVMMLVSAVLAIVVQIESYFKEKHHSQKMGTALLIGLAYSASIGGMSTLVGTPTNMIFFREYSEKYPMNTDMNFTNWFIIAFPVALILLLFAFLVIKKLFLSKSMALEIESIYFKKSYKELGDMTYEEKIVSIIFFFTAFLWFTRADINIGFINIPGWSNLFENKEFIHDSTVALVMSLMLFLIPSKSQKGRSLISWNEVSKLPFDIVLLFGGGFALAKGFDSSGLSTWLANQLDFSADSNIYMLVLGLCFLVVLISEFASNVACIQLMLPVLIAIQNSMNIHPLYLMIPATLAASLGFMLPVATAPNTIVYGTKRLRVNDMLKAGFIINLIGILLITVFVAIIQKVI